MLGRRILFWFTMLLSVAAFSSGCEPQKSSKTTKDKKGKQAAKDKKEAQPAQKDNRFVCIAHGEKPEDQGFSANHLVGLKDALWENGSTLNVHFMDGPKNLHDAVRNHAPEWSQYANITFKFFDPESPPPNTDVRVTFDAQKCSGGCAHYSALGTFSHTAIAQRGHSMCLSCMEQEPKSRWSVVIVHEFGHALGLFHEHQRAGIKWNKPVVYKFCEQTQGWDKAKCDHNILTPLEEKVPAHQLVGTPYDPLSIMHYDIRPEWTTDGKGVSEPDKLSEMDKKGIAKLYPKTNQQPGPTPSGGYISLTNSYEGGSWTLFIKGPEDKLSQIKSVRYVLHPSMVPDEADGDASKPGHPYTAAGDQTFTARAFVTFNDGTAELLKHTISLTPSGGGGGDGDGQPAAGTGVPECDDMYERFERCFGQELTAADRRKLEQEKEQLTRLATTNLRSNIVAFCNDRLQKMEQAGCRKKAAGEQ